MGLLFFFFTNFLEQIFVKRATKGYLVCCVCEYFFFNFKKESSWVKERLGMYFDEFVKTCDVEERGAHVFRLESGKRMWREREREIERER